MNINRDIKNSMWNRIFHKEQIKKNSDRANALRTIIKLAPAYIEKIGYVTYINGDNKSACVVGAPTLCDVMQLHKCAWSDGFQNISIGPNEYGSFRTASIETMEANEVYLGLVWDLPMHEIPVWEGKKNEKPKGGKYSILNYLSDYQIVLGQYKQKLTTNIRQIKINAEKELDRLIALGY